jgi:hypothetical protein
MTADEFRKMALSFPGAVESSHMNHPDFRVGKRIFATLGAPDDEWGMVRLTPAEQTRFVALNRKVFVPCNGAWGRQGCTYVRLAKAQKRQIRAAMKIAFERLA